MLFQNSDELTSLHKINLAETNFYKHTNSNKYIHC